jgi:hypothetical protein
MVTARQSAFLACTAAPANVPTPGTATTHAGLQACGGGRPQRVVTCAVRCRQPLIGVDRSLSARVTAAAISYDLAGTVRAGACRCCPHLPDRPPQETCRDSVRRADHDASPSTYGEAPHRPAWNVRAFRYSAECSAGPSFGGVTEARPHTSPDQGACQPAHQRIRAPLHKIQAARLPIGRPLTKGATTYRTSH